MPNLENLEKRIDKRFDDLTALMSEFANDVTARFDRVEVKLEEHDRRFDELDAKFNRLLDTVGGLMKRIDDYETELAARDHKIERLERRVEQIATKTGVKLS
jgi:archaellum component FlaC